MDLKAQIKSRGRTVKSYKGTRMFNKYQKDKQAYKSEFKFQKKALKKGIRKKLKREQLIMDIQNQIHGLTVKEEKNVTIDTTRDLIAERVQVINSLFTFTTSSPEEDRKRLL
jgi:DNA-nicking Smr family endonuclease